MRKKSMRSAEDTGVLLMLLKIIDVLVKDIMDSDLEIVKWRHSLLKYLQPDFADLLAADILNNLNSGRYMEFEGYRLYVGLVCGGKDPQQSSAFHRRLHRLSHGTSKYSDMITYAISQRGGMDMFSSALERLKEKTIAVANGKSAINSLEPVIDELNAIVLAYDQESHYLSKVNDVLREALDESEVSIISLKEEIALLYKLLRSSGVKIPEEGHHVDIKSFASSDDPYREDYEGDYELPWRFFDTEDDD